MPITRKFGKNRRPDFETLTPSQLRTLKYGSSLFAWPAFASVDELEAAWKIHRREIVPAFIAMHPGCRPFGWWKCDHGRERPIVNHHIHDEVIEKSQRAERFGFLHSSVMVDRDSAGNWLMWQERQHEYLRRNNLLTEAELAIDPDKLADEAI